MSLDKGMKQLTKARKELYRMREFLTFDKFIIEKMLQKPVADYTDEIRKEAYGVFRKRTGNMHIAAEATMHRWFGIWGYAKPRREQIYQMAVAMGLDLEETEEYLQRGINDCSFIVSDYHEMVWIYIIEHQMDIDAYEHMIATFERHVKIDIEYSTTISTKHIWKQYQIHKGKDTDAFLKWMIQNAKYFKGFSATALNYLSEYRDLVLKYVKMDVMERLDNALAETTYKSWKKRFLLRRNMKEYDLIKKYLKSKPVSKGSELSESLIASIEELAKLAYGVSDNNSLMRSAVYSGRSVKGANLEIIDGMTMKRMSDLFRTADHKLQYNRVQVALRQLSDDSITQCPDEIQELIAFLSKGKVSGPDVAKAREWLEHYISENRRRQLSVQKADLLPMILFVAQHEYEKEMVKQGVEYNKDDAKKLFIDKANAVLASCGMEMLCEDRELDAIILLGFQENDMYTFSDLVDELEKQYSGD